MKYENNIEQFFTFAAIKGWKYTRINTKWDGLHYEINVKDETGYISLWENEVITDFRNKGKLGDDIDKWARQNGRCEPFWIDLPSAWREWNEDHRRLLDGFKKWGKIEEALVSDDFRSQRESVFHSYMFRQKSYYEEKIELIEKLIRNWFQRNCFTHLDVENLIKDILKDIKENHFMPSDPESIDLATVTNSISRVMGSYCPYKYEVKSNSCIQTGEDYGYCFIELIDSLFPYITDKMLAYNKTNLLKFIGRKEGELTWIDLKEKTIIEEKMEKGLIDAGFTPLPQYQAYDFTHRYRLDFLIKTLKGPHIAIECDGLQFHCNKPNYIRDRKRDRYLQSNGLYVMRFSSVEIFNDLDSCINEIDEVHNKIQKNEINVNLPYRISYYGYGK